MPKTRKAVFVGSSMMIASPRHAAYRARQRDTLDRVFWTKIVIQPNGCWAYQGAITQHGYGALVRNGEKIGAHKRAWELAKGPIPDGLYVLHHCDNPPCCNPAHLFLGTQIDNLADMRAKGRDNSFGLLNRRAP
jgi:hypothetical protein